MDEVVFIDNHYLCLMGKEESTNPNRKFHPALKYAGMGTELLVVLGLGVWGGYSLDQKWEVLPLFTVLFPLLGLVYFFRKLFISLQQDQKK